MLVGNIVTTGHHARVVSPNYSPERKINKIKRCKKALNVLGNISSMTMCISPSLEAPTGKPYISLSSLHPLL
jgi:hypothetical protein